MPDKPATRISLTRSGSIPRSLVEPVVDHESPSPTKSSQQHDEDHRPATTTTPVVKEGEDNSAERDEDAVSGS